MLIKSKLIVIANLLTRLLTLVGLIFAIFGLYLAFFQHSDIWYSFFLVGGFLLFEGLNLSKGFSVLKNPKRFLSTWLIFGIITVGVEMVGNAWLNLWNYPTFGEWEYLIHVLVIGYPLTGFVGLELFVWLQNILESQNSRRIVLPLSALLFGYFNEYPNTFAREWEYVNWPFGEFLGIPILISLLWLFLLTALFFRKPFYFSIKSATNNPRKS